MPAIVSSYADGVPFSSRARAWTLNAADQHQVRNQGQGRNQPLARASNCSLRRSSPKIMPNGNLVISGSQEVRVNYEIRVLQVSGIVRPRDISAESSVSYEKIAEARIAYGGRGRLNEVQQPGWGQQLVDKIYPF